MQEQGTDTQAVSMEKAVAKRPSKSESNTFVREDEVGKLLLASTLEHTTNSTITPNASAKRHFYHDSRCVLDPFPPVTYEKDPFR